MKNNYNEIQKIINRSKNKAFVFLSNDSIELDNFIENIYLIYETRNIYKVNALKVLQADMERIKEHHFSNSISDEKKVIVISNFENLSLKHQNELLIITEENITNDYFVFTTKNINKIIPTLLSRVQIYKFKKTEQNNIDDKRVRAFSRLTNNNKNLEKILMDEDSIDVFNVASTLVDNILVGNFHQAASFIIFEKEKITNRELFFDIFLFLFNEEKKINSFLINEINKLIIEFKKNIYLKTNEILFYDSFAIKLKRIGELNEK